MDSSDLDHHLIHGSLDPHELAPSPNCISTGSAVFAQLTRVANLHRQTTTQTSLRATFFIFSIYALRVRYAAWKCRLVLYEDCKADKTRIETVQEHGFGAR